LILAVDVGSEMTNANVSEVKALVFDVFGTVVDWRGSIIAEGLAWSETKKTNIDWPDFSDRLRSGYHPTMNRVRTGEMPWTRLDDLHRLILDQVLQDLKINTFTDEEKTHWAHVWRRLKPWPDSVEGLSRLKRKYIIGPLSNGNIALMTNLAKHSKLPWDVILGSELVKHYKPDKEVYISVPYFLDLRPEQVMLVAAHAIDLDSARKCGLRTGFIYRPNEFGNGKVGVPDHAKRGDFDIVSADAIDLATQMGA